ncbi:hypothetical protein AVEN_63540-1 [Araneus ventricosus]|uniref:Uncharacterized protein n=1 Tax=Araneus ventricosus TaxID=182803 RepID=A0A4Y2V348_ARAVE|nr:hypothetical protein AVEN_63540-1 [Araneus ventricosus]
MRKVKTAKNSGWKSFCTIASNPYGTHYKAAFRKAIKPAELIALNNHDPSGNHLKIAQDILEKIFPHPANSNSSTYIPPCTANDCSFTKGEVAMSSITSPKEKHQDQMASTTSSYSQFSRNSPSSSWNFLTLALNWLNFPIPLRLEISFFFANTANLKQKRLLTGPYLCSRQ